jgi:pimeloyl-ACP methyl ester carboxylesterase
MTHQTGFRVTTAATRPGMPSGAIERERLRLRARGLVFDVLAAGPPTGEPVVLLHGFPQTAACWIRVAETLAVAGYRCWRPTSGATRRAPGRRRCGPTGCRSWSPTCLPWPRRSGRPDSSGRHDWGGAVAWVLAGWHPERVATLTSVSTPHPRALAAALLTSGQLLHSAYIGLFRIPRLPELALGARGSRGLRFLLAAAG